MPRPVKHPLRLVAPEDELSGRSPAFLERFARKLKIDSKEHAAWIHLLGHLPRQTAPRCLPQSQLSYWSQAQRVLNDWRSRPDSRKAGQLRAEIFSALPIVEAQTREAIRQALQQRQEPATSLDHHADHVVERYGGLAAHFCLASICHILDALQKPEAGLDVFGDIASALAYQNTGLGSARLGSFRAAALEQAEWELARSAPQKRAGETSAAQDKERKSYLALQVFHEYLGGQFKSHQDAELAQLLEFARWSLSPGIGDL
ncbi:MAG: hypothetical protein MK135_06500 [Polyangiaceae bacterium]|nr:hypothetical protein [Polyangiaceae bacterium]